MAWVILISRFQYHPFLRFKIDEADPSHLEFAKQLLDGLIAQMDGLATADNDDVKPFNAKFKQYSDFLKVGCELWAVIRQV